MPLDKKIIRQNHGNRNVNNKIPFIICMVDRNDTVQTIPFPQGVSESEVLLGIELMINPASLSSNLSKIVNRTQTMTAFFEEHWGEELDTITFQGSTASFVTGGNDIYSIRNTFSNASPAKNYLKNTNGVTQVLGSSGSTNDMELGLTTTRRRQSVSYIHFKRLIDIIRLNGCIYDPNFGTITDRLYIQLFYGNSLFKGYFESVDVTESATSPFLFQYTITFKSEKTIYSYTDI